MTVGIESFNSHLGINPVSYKVLAIVRSSSKLKTAIARASQAGLMADVKALAWYNGREKAIVISLDCYKGDIACVVFGEHRCSDDIFVDTFMSKEGGSNPPIWMDDGYENGYKNRKFFSPNPRRIHPVGHAAKAADVVVAFLVDALDTMVGKMVK